MVFLLIVRSRGLLREMKKAGRTLTENRFGAYSSALICRREIILRGLIFSGLFWVLFGTAIYAGYLPVKKYTAGDGLLSDSVGRVKQDSRGFMWFAGAQGASRFDGAGFTHFTAGDGLPHRVVNDILETRGGDYFFATENGLASLNPTGERGSASNPLFAVLRADDANAKNFSVLFEDDNNVVWAGSQKGLYRLKETNGTFELE